MMCLIDVLVSLNYGAYSRIRYEGKDRTPYRNPNLEELGRLRLWPRAVGPARGGSLLHL